MFQISRNRVLLHRRITVCTKVGAAAGFVLIFNALFNSFTNSQTQAQFAVCIILIDRIFRWNVWYSYVCVYTPFAHTRTTHRYRYHVSISISSSHL